MEVGISDRDPIVSTIAPPYKYATTDGPSFLDLIGRVLGRANSVHLVAVGTSDETPGWDELKRAYPDRVHLLGHRTEYLSVIEASDVYLDSFPFSSITAMLEAAFHAVPVVTRSNPPNGPLNFDDFGLHPPLVSSADEWMALVELWCSDTRLAAAVGADMKDAVNSVHGSDAWVSQLDGLYAMAWQRVDTPELGGDTMLTEYDDAIFELHRAGGMTRDFGQLMAANGVHYHSESQMRDVSA